MSFLYQRCYTNLLRYNGETRVGGWTAAAVSRDLPPSVQNMCEQFQSANASEKNVTATDITGRRPLRLYEYLCDGQYAYVIRTRYGLRDHGNRPNLFSHAYIAPLDGCALTQPEQLLSLDASCFEQDVSDAERNADPAAESKLLAERAEKRLNANGVLDKRPESNDPFDFQAALDADALRFSSDNKEQYRTLLECVYAQMNEQRETGTRLPPLYVEYAAAGDADASMRRLLCAILHGLPYWMRRELKASNWCGIANTPKDLMFVTEGAKMLSGRNGGRYVILSSGETGLKGKYIGRAKRCGYLSYAVMKLTPGEFAGFFDGLDRIAKALGDADASSEEIRKLVWQCYWNDASKDFTGMDAPNLDGLSEKDAARLLSDVTKSGAYSEALRELVDKVKEKAGTLTDALKSDLSKWESECERQSRVQTQPQPVQQTQYEPQPTPQNVQQPQTPPPQPVQQTPLQNAQQSQTPPPQPVQQYVPPQPQSVQPPIYVSQSPQIIYVQQPQPQQIIYVQQPQPVQPTLTVTQLSAPSYDPAPTPNEEPLPVIDWDAVERDWRALPISTQQKMSSELESLLNKPNLQIAYGDFRKLVDSSTEQYRNIYYLLLVENRINGKIRVIDLMKRYYPDYMKTVQGASVEKQWEKLSIVCSLCERMKNSEFKALVENRAKDLFKIPGGLTSSSLNNYSFILERLYPNDLTKRTMRIKDARQYYWSEMELIASFSFNALSEYEAFDDGEPHFFLELARAPAKFHPEDLSRFLETTYRLFQSGDFEPSYIQNYSIKLYKEINRRNETSFPSDYESWMYMAGLSKNQNMLSAVEELYQAFPAFEPEKILKCYRVLIRECKSVKYTWKVAETEIRKVAHELIKNACCQHDDVKSPIPLDLWILLGKEGKKMGLNGNYFAIFEKWKPDARVLMAEDPTQTARNSDFLRRDEVCREAQNYITDRENDSRIQYVVKQWLNEARRRR